MDKEEHIAKLPNSPLQEVVFELHLEEDINAKGIRTNENFDFALGLFAEKIKNDFPKRISFPKHDKIRIFPNISFQFWKDEGVWPVIQLGDGLLTVNDTEKNYIWSEYSYLVRDCMTKLSNSFSEPVKIRQVSLRYIDAIEMNEMTFEQKQKFINENFKVSLDNNFKVLNGESSGMNITSNFKINDGSTVNFVISNGKSKQNKPAIVWQYQIFNNIVTSFDDVNKWLDAGHDILSDLFKNSITSKFYDSFK
ncbi:TIGR04255 family protein [Aureibaculum conchae]|uniref:TIGR04255 family protein n=1 Tax=Aureibaculum sp. 2308TA14-22 TaxID=3108392 RepID=UPI00339B0ACB